MSVGKQFAFPDPAPTKNGAPGMTYRQWLIGQALNGVCCGTMVGAAMSHVTTIPKEVIVESVMVVVDELVARLDAEAKP